MTKEEEKIFMRGFNQGYILERYDKDLLEQLLKSKNSNSLYFEGLRDGKQMAIEDRVEEMLKNKSKQKDQERDK